MIGGVNGANVNLYSGFKTSESKALAVVSLVRTKIP